MKSVPMLALIIVALVAAGAGFFSGIKFQESKTTARFRAFQNGGNANFRGPGGNQANFRDGSPMGQGSFRPVSGEILKADAQTVTLKLRDDSSKLVLLSQDTAIHQTSQGSAADLTPGTQVMVVGTQNADGSISAQNIQINPAGVNAISPTPTP